MLSLSILPYSIYSKADMIANMQEHGLIST